MKSLLSVLALMLITNLSSGQFDANITKANWKPGKENTIYGTTILRIEGKNDFRGITNVAYQTLAQLNDYVNKTAEKEMWTAEKKKGLLDAYANRAPGGQITFYISRSTIDAANSDMFSVIVKDSVENELFRKEFKSDIPEVPDSSGLWWNMFSTLIDTEIKGSFFIYVIDRLSDDNGKHKFQVKR